MENRVHFLLVLLFSLEIIFSTVNSTPFPLLGQDVEGNEEGGKKIKTLAGANTTSENSSVTAVDLVGHRGSCIKEKNNCDTAKLLICTDRGFCECDEESNVELFYSKSLQKCVSEEDASMQSGNSWEDEEKDLSNEETKAGGEEIDEGEDELPHQHDAGEVAEKSKGAAEGEGDTNKIKKEVQEDNGGGLLGAGVGSAGIAQPCTNDGQCQARKFGKYSRCLTSTGSCECYDTETSGFQKRSTVLVNGTCYINKTINDVCEKHIDCHATIKGDAWCATDVSSSVKTCQCELLHFWDSSLEECLRFGRDGVESPCKKDYQCTAEEGLGALSRCGAETGKCECYDTGSNGQNPTVYYDDTKSCYLQRSMLSFCSTDKECEASLGLNSFCGNHTEFLPEENVCQCMDGKSCEERPGISTYTMIVFIVAGIVMLVGIVLCFVLRRNDRYDIVSQSP